MQPYKIFFLGIIFLITALIPVQASRLALVIGNSNYTISPLRNPINDANDVAKILKKLGFEVILKTNANRRSMIKAIQKFGRRLHQADVGLFFYAGHGLQVNGHNYLVPVDANIQSEADIEPETVEAARVLKQMELSNNGINIVILDACRNNPYKRSFSRDLTRGLARLDDAPTGTFIVYATSPGDVAQDGKGRNSPFTTNLLRALKTMPHLKIEELFKKLAKNMIENSTNPHPQTPWRHSSLINDFCFSTCPGTDVSQQLRLCKKHLKANRLTTGRSGTAFVCYKEVLTKDPNNLEAKTGLKKIEKRYATWIKRALYRGQGYKAKRYIPKLCKVNPESAYLAKINKRLKTSCPTYTRSFVSRSLETSNKGTFQDFLKNGSLAPEMVWIPANKSISRFAIGRYEVTFAEYNKFVEATNREKPDDQDWGYDKRPVINISWEEAMAYAEWLSHETGQKYSLPTEAEWQYANNIETIQKDTCSYANLKDCNEGTIPVGEFKPKKFGLFDMSGNVSEWTCSDKDNNNKCVGENPSNPIIILGDSWYTTQTRISYPYELSDDYIGFRLVRH